MISQAFVGFGPLESGLLSEKPQMLTFSNGDPGDTICLCPRGHFTVMRVILALNRKVIVLCL